MGNVPFSLAPSVKDYLWGGDRLKSEYQKNVDIFPLAETWECSTHPDGESIVTSGQYEGMSLGQVLKEHPDLLGKKVEEEGKLPILVKLIDASSDLSVQVHPSDEYAGLRENGQKGKTEMWYVLEADENAQLVYGLSHDCTKEDIKKAVEEKSLSKYLNYVKVSKGDIFFIEPGTIHAIGSGIVLAEVQENSNLTYRLYDYDRVDRNGDKRELHLDKALEVASLNKSLKPRQPLRVLKYAKGSAEEVLCRCKYFEVHRVIINTEQGAGCKLENDNDSYSVWLCTDGFGSFSFAGQKLEYKKGSCIFVPANSDEIEVSGKSELIKIRG